MKKLFFFLLVIAGLTLNSFVAGRAPINPAALIKAATVKVIKAIDLKIQRMQNKTIWLQNAQKLLENELSKLKLNEITDWTRKQKEQYQKYFDELNTVKATIRDYQRVKEVTQKQARLVADYQRIWTLIKSDNHFLADEKKYMDKVYNGILGQSLENLNQVYRVLQSYSLKMSDAERIEIINSAANRIDDNYDDLKRFNQQNIQLSIQRAKSQQEIDAIKMFYGL